MYILHLAANKTFIDTAEAANAFAYKASNQLLL